MGNAGRRVCAGWREIKGGKWDNHNSISNKIFKKRKERKRELLPFMTAWVEPESIELSENEPGSENTI